MLNHLAARLGLDVKAHSAAAETCPVFFGGSGGQPVKIHWGYPDPSNAEGATRPSAALHAALVEIGRS